MTVKPNDPRHDLIKIADLYIDDLLATSNEELMAEAKHCPDLHKSGEIAKNVYQRALKTVGSKRLEAARQARLHDAALNPQQEAAVDISKARRLLARIAANDKSFGLPITLAARNLSEITDSEVLSIIRDLKHLGALPEDGEW